MKEDFVQYLWKHRMICGQPLQTTDGRKLEVISPGQENHDSGPDFTAACVRIDSTLWAGNVEVHVKSSQWYAHGHDQDPAYDNIILHVVFHADQLVQERNGKAIPHLEVRHYCRPGLAKNYAYLMQNPHHIACEKLIHLVDDFSFSHWLGRLCVCRVERKAVEINRFLEYFGNHWEQLSLFLVARYLGGKANAGAFGLLIQRTPFEVISKNHHDLFALEALLIGQAGLLTAAFDEEYPIRLQDTYNFLGKKYSLPDRLPQELWKYARMRPANFPDIRIAQLAAVIHANEAQLFRKIMEADNTDKVRQIFHLEMNTYWNTHHRLGKISPARTKKIGLNTVWQILINVAIPLLFVYGKARGKDGLVDQAMDLIEKTPSENNRITRMWRDTGRVPVHAGESQGMLELYHHYCLPKKCLKCPVGHQVLNKNIR